MFLVQSSLISLGISGVKSEDFCMAIWRYIGSAIFAISIKGTLTKRYVTLYVVHLFWRFCKPYLPELFFHKDKQFLESESLIKWEVIKIKSFLIAQTISLHHGTRSAFLGGIKLFWDTINGIFQAHRWETMPFTELSVSGISCHTPQWYLTGVHLDTTVLISYNACVSCSTCIWAC